MGQYTLILMVHLWTVSPYGGLVHVVFAVNSVPSEGITALIESSHKLIACNIITADRYMIGKQEG